jgi:hypothetical protein
MRAQVIRQPVIREAKIEEEWERVRVRKRSLYAYLCEIFREDILLDEQVEQIPTAHVVLKENSA